MTTKREELLKKVNIFEILFGIKSYIRLNGFIEEECEKNKKLSFDFMEKMWEFCSGTGIIP